MRWVPVYYDTVARAITMITVVKVAAHTATATPVITRIPIATVFLPPLYHSVSWLPPPMRVKEIEKDVVGERVGGSPVSPEPSR